MNVIKNTGNLRALYLKNERNIGLLVSIIIISLLLRFLFIGRADLFAEEAYYWNYAAHMDFGYLDHPPMVAILIKLSTTLLGNSEFAVRFLSIVCWAITVYFSVRLTELIHKGTGIYVVMLFAILPFFFAYSLIITPDVPLLACWSACLYYLYQAICLNRARAWYMVGIAIGLGMLSKYSICLLVPAILLCVLREKSQRFWFFKKEPYIAAIIAICLFSPVIYWNATHDWVSFAFQSTRRLHGETHFSLHALFGLFILFLTPVGVFGFFQLFKKQISISSGIEPRALFFLKTCTLVPLATFALFSLSHEIKFNWIGPSLLAILPVQAILIKTQKINIKHWFITAFIALFLYAGFIGCVGYGTVSWINKVILNKYINWRGFTTQLHDVATQLEKSGHRPLFIPLDNYSIASELVYYQAKLYPNDTYAVMGAEQFGYDSLMYRYWVKNKDLTGKYAIIIAALPFMFENGLIHDNATVVTAPQMFWAYSQGKHTPVRQYYYEVVRF